MTIMKFRSITCPLTETLWLLWKFSSLVSTHERNSVFKLDPTSEAHANRRHVVKNNWLALGNMAMETALLAAFAPCLALPHMQEVDAVKKNNAAGGLITDDQADKLFELSSLKLIVQAFGMVGGKKVHPQKHTLSFHPFF